jgi:hypothetical protein
VTAGKHAGMMHASPYIKAPLLMAHSLLPTLEGLGAIGVPGAIRTIEVSFRAKEKIGNGPD